MASGYRTFSVTLTVGLCSATASATSYEQYTSTKVTVVPGAAVKLQVLVPGETAVPGSSNGKTGSPLTDGRNTFIVTINACDSKWNVNSADASNIDITQRIV